MGLNLNIQRVIFQRIDKFDGKGLVQLPISQLKQIAGRAGRYRTAYESGLVTT
jgi:ATP-dependent RNA helicase SUPV3L1/SUV3